MISSTVSLCLSSGYLNLKVKASCSFSSFKSVANCMTCSVVTLKHFLLVLFNPSHPPKSQYCHSIFNISNIQQQNSLIFVQKLHLISCKLHNLSFLKKIYFFPLKSDKFIWNILYKCFCLYLSSFLLVHLIKCYKSVGLNLSLSLSIFLCESV